MLVLDEEVEDEGWCFEEGMVGFWVLEWCAGFEIGVCVLRFVEA